jgi:NitT/TauT family transport system permease protein
MMKHIFVKRALFIIILFTVWEAVVRTGMVPELLFPPLGSVFKALAEVVESGELFKLMGFSLYLILSGLAIGLALAVVLSTLAIVSRTFDSFLDTVVTIMHPLPGIALLPLAVLWFGTGQKSIIFIIVHATLWPMVLNTLTGFKSIPVIYREVGENIGLTGPRLVFSIMAPAAFPYLLAGFKIGWARAWRALIAAEMIFGTSGTQGGLGWFIYQQRYFMDVSGVFAALFVIIIVGILVEDLFFGLIEKKTIKRWGMTA